MTSLPSLPSDVLFTIIEKGGLSSQDVARLSLANTRLARLAQNKHIWKYLYQREWGQYVDAIDYGSQLPRNDLEKIKILVQSQRTFNANIQSAGNHVEELHDPIFWIVAAKALPRVINQLKAQVNSKSPNCLLEPVCNTITMLQRISCKIAMEWHIDHFSDTKLDHELFWFKESHFDPAFASLSCMRQLKLDAIRSTLKKHVHDNILLRNIDYRILLIDSGQTIWFESEGVYVYFVKNIIELVLTTLSSAKIAKHVEQDHLGQFYSGSTWEDLSIVRIYSGDCRGDASIVMSILIKVLREFFKDFDIRVGSKPAQKFRVDMSKSFLHLGFTNTYYLYLDPKRRTKKPYDCAILSYPNAVRFLRSLNFKSSQIANHIKPIDYSFWVQKILTFEHSPTTYKLSDIVSKSSNNIPQTPTRLISEKQIQFIEVFFNFVDEQSMSNCRNLCSFVAQFGKTDSYSVVMDILKRNPEYGRHIDSFPLPELIKEHPVLRGPKIKGKVCHVSNNNRIAVLICHDVTSTEHSITHNLAIIGAKNAKVVEPTPAEMMQFLTHFGYENVGSLFKYLNMEQCTFS